MKILAKYFGYRIQDLIKGTTILKTLKLLEKSQYWSEEMMYDYRLKKLQGLILFSYNNVPYYHELFDKNNINPNDIKSLEDIKKIPILTKDIARLNQSKLISTNKGFRNVKIGKTGGTTGVPLVFHSDTNNRSFAWAAYYRWYDYMGINKEDKVLTLWGTSTVLNTSPINNLKKKIIDTVQNNKTINSFNINENSIQLIYNQLIEYNPTLLKGYLSAIILLAKYMQENNLKPNRALRAISSTTETLLPIYREYIFKIFGVPIYDQYGCGEVSSIAFECNKHQGLHINEEHVLVECLNENDIDVIDQKGRLIITSLDNYAMPFIRYENGDMAILQSKKCTCGINSRLMSSIDGRTIDTITLNNGSKVHGVFFTDLFYEIGITTDLISRFQICQHLERDVDVYLETSKSISADLINRLKSEMLKFLPNVNITIMKFIPNEENGKFRYIKSN